MKSTTYLFIVTLFISLINSEKSDNLTETEAVTDVPDKQEQMSSESEVLHSIESLTAKGDQSHEGFVEKPARSRSGQFRRKQELYAGIPKVPSLPFHNDSESSSRELDDWKEEWDTLWKKKTAGIEHTMPTTPVQGDVVNMAAARPWGDPCGDPNQHDMPWGSCVLAVECEAEDRIYRGDSQCGRTDFVCCNIMVQKYDQIQANDGAISEHDTEMTDDSMEQQRKLDAKNSLLNAIRRKRKRAVMRYKRKKKIRAQIIHIIKEITKMLRYIYRNSTKNAEKKTKNLKKYIKMMKKMFKKDRQSVQDIFNSEMVAIDNRLFDELIAIMKFNNNFIKNTTFRDIVVNRTINKEGARMLVEAYPNLYKYIPKVIRNKDILRPTRLRLSKRRSGG